MRERGFDLETDCGGGGHLRVFALFSLFFVLSSQLCFAPRPVQLLVKSFNFSEKEKSQLGSGARGK
jgi:hypothetical protein